MNGYMSQETVEIKFYKDLVHQSHEAIKSSGFLKECLQCMSLFVNIPLIGGLCCRSFLVVCYAMIRLRRTGRYNALYRLLTHCLMGKTFRKNSREWWYLMRATVAFTQERQHYYAQKELALEDSLILLGYLGPKPLQGYDVAYVFVGYSLWYFERGDIHAALDLIKTAESADPTWGYPAYLHGWYSLFDKVSDAVDYFSQAVQMDWGFLQKMKQDNICKEHPEILHEVRRRALVDRSRA
jgi:hypothetical protein